MTLRRGNSMRQMWRIVAGAGRGLSSQCSCQLQAVTNIELRRANRGRPTSFMTYGHGKALRVTLLEPGSPHSLPERLWPTPPEIAALPPNALPVSARPRALSNKTFGTAITTVCGTTNKQAK